MYQVISAGDFEYFWIHVFTWKKCHLAQKRNLRQKSYFFHNSFRLPLILVLLYSFDFHEILQEQFLRIFVFFFFFSCNYDKKKTFEELFYATWKKEKRRWVTSTGAESILSTSLTTFRKKIRWIWWIRVFMVTVPISPIPTTVMGIPMVVLVPCIKLFNTLVTIFYNFSIKEGTV